MKQAELKRIFEAYFHDWWEAHRPDMKEPAELSCADLACVSDFTSGKTGRVEGPECSSGT
ncbi:MAG: hypothetical protein AAGE03_12035 [Pseudomonadota bacterium]